MLQSRRSNLKVNLQGKPLKESEITSPTCRGGRC